MSDLTLTVQKRSGTDIKRRVGEMIDRVGLPNYCQSQMKAPS